ncbi:hypothetical protein [Mesonia maritima]|uniref:Uncharacterized protein n=1 Tax=Mesonia maritima TaxID=1793873 RepID=A0ABU1K7Y9_9FLAO|nr:hypothetical protein [Mesonia maritima]MDR6300658.1 hypothetical protein [Mesonia maritima]
MEFNGFRITPLGNAELSIENNVLRVSGISESGLDGVSIDTEGKGNYTVNFGQLGMIAERNGVLKTTTLKRNGLQQVGTFFESFKWLDEDEGKVVSGYNLAYLPKDFTVFGKLEGENVFEIGSGDLEPVEEIPPSAEWLGIVAALIGAAVAVWKELRTKKTTTVETTRDGEGNITQVKTTVTEDPEPFEVEVNGELYTVDEYGIDYNYNIPYELIGNPMVEYEKIAEQITGVNLGEFEITSIEQG